MGMKVYPRSEPPVPRNASINVSRGNGRSATCGTEVNRVTHILGLLAIGWFACPIIAQIDRATLNGRVSETGGTGLADVTVEMVSMSNGLHRAAKTNASGVYQVPGLPIGRYAVAFSRPSVQVL